MSTNTVELHRVIRATPERVYRAFLDDPKLPARMQLLTQLVEPEIGEG